jgi:CheY-like chemotaxis protein
MDLFHLAAHQEPDLIMIKENMRNVQGRQLVDMMRGYSATAAIPVLLYESEGGAGPGTADVGTGVVRTGDTATLMAAVKQALREPAEPGS